MHGTALQYIWTLMTNTKTADTCHTLMKSVMEPI